MKKDTKDLFFVCAFCIYLGLMFLLLCLMPKDDFSQHEKRYLQSTPDLSASSVFSGRFGEEAERYASDHIPFREAFVELYVRFDMTLNLASTRDIYLGKSGRLYERPCVENRDAVTCAMTAINDFCETIDRDVDMMLVPSAGYAMSGDMPPLCGPYLDDELIDQAFSLAGPRVREICVLDKLCSNDAGEMYYATDHHWTSKGAYTAYEMYMQLLGRNYLDSARYSVRGVDGFQGSTYSRACLWDLPAEQIELWDSGGEFTVQFSDREGIFEGLFFEDRLEEADKYMAFLDGNHPLVRISSGASEAEGSILVIRDSYANCFGCFLADSYKNVTLVDLRYYKKPVSELVREESYDDVLILYSIGNFMTDANIVWLS